MNSPTNLWVPKATKPFPNYFNKGPILLMKSWRGHPGTAIHNYFPQKNLRTVTILLPGGFMSIFSASTVSQITLWHLARNSWATFGGSQQLLQPLVLWGVRACKQADDCTGTGPGRTQPSQGSTELSEGSLSAPALAHRWPSKGVKKASP